MSDVLNREIQERGYVLTRAFGPEESASEISKLWNITDE